MELALALDLLGANRLAEASLQWSRSDRGGDRDRGSMGLACRLIRGPFLLLEDGRAVAIYTLCSTRLCRYAAGGWRRLKVRDARYASVARARSATGQPETFSALFDMASSRAHQAAHPTDDAAERRRRPSTTRAGGSAECRYADADLLRCVSW